MSGASALAAAKHIAAAERQCRLTFGSHEAVFPGANPGGGQFFCIRLSFRKDGQFTTEERLRDVPGDLELLGHGALPALLLHVVRQLTGHLSRTRPFLMRIGEHAQALELGRPNEFQQ